MLSIFHVIHEMVRVVLIGYSFPSKAKEIFPVSSDTTSTSASLCSERPIAARCRVPSFFPLITVFVRGSTLAAEMNWFSLTKTAPSCRGFPG